LKVFAGADLADGATVTSDGYADYNVTSLGDRSHDQHVQTNAERAEHDTLQRAHWAVSMLKRWLIGTHAGAVKPRHLQAYLDEFAFRWHRRNIIGVGRISARTIEMLVSKAKRTLRDIVE
jgi:ISXO2-like transposase domain